MRVTVLFFYWLVSCALLFTRPGLSQSNSSNSIVSEFRVSEKKGGPQQSFPWIAQRGNQGYAMVWWDLRNRYAIWGQLLDNSGEKIGPNFLVEEEKVKGIITESKLRMATNELGDFIVIWSSGIPTYSSPNIFVRLFDSTGKALSESIALTSGKSPTVNINPDVVLFNDRTFATFLNSLGGGNLVRGGPVVDISCLCVPGVSLWALCGLHVHLSLVRKRILFFG